MLRHCSQSLRWGKGISEERGDRFGGMGESFLNASDENGEEEWGEVEWTTTTKMRTRNEKFDD